MPRRFSLRRHLARILRQPCLAVPAPTWQQHLNSAHLSRGKQSPMMPCVSGLGARLAPAFALSATRSLLAGQPVGGRRLGGVGRVLFAQRQLPLQIGNLFLGVGDLFLGVSNLLLLFGELLFAPGSPIPEILNLSLLFLKSSPQPFPARLLPS